IRDCTWLAYQPHLLPSPPPIRPLPGLPPRPKLSDPSPLIPVPSGGSSFGGASFGASSLIIGSSIFCSSCGGGGFTTGGGGGGGGGARLTSVSLSCFDDPPFEVSFATTTMPAMTTAMTMIAIRNRFKKFCGASSG